MPAPHDLDPDAMTEEERLAKRRYQAGFAFETNPPMVQRSRLDHFGWGIEEARA